MLCQYLMEHSKEFVSLALRCHITKRGMPTVSLMRVTYPRLYA